MTRQCRGALLLVLIVSAIYCGRFFIMPGGALSPDLPPYTDLRWGDTVVKLSGDVRSEGIYFVSPGATLRDLLEIAGSRRAEGVAPQVLQRALETGMSVEIRKSAARKWDIRFDRMANAERFALGMHIGLNSATAADLMLVRGIGAKTAAGIIETRNKTGGFREVENLLEVKGIGEKKLEKIGRYFYIDAVPGDVSDK